MTTVTLMHAPTVNKGVNIDFQTFCTSPLKCNSMSLHSTHENRYFGASFTSIGGVEPDISMPQNTEKDQKKSTLGALISWLLHPYEREICTKVSIFTSVTQWYWVLFKGRFRKNLNIKKTLVLKRCFFIKVSLRGLQWHILHLVYPLWCWRNQRLKIFWLGHHLKATGLY